MTQSFEALTARIGADGAVDTDEVLDMRRAIFPDGAVDRTEAAALLQLAARATEGDEAWTQMLVEAIGDHVMGPDRFVADEDAAWFLAHVGEGPLRRDLLLGVLRRADCAPECLAAAAREAVLASLANAPIGASDLNAIRTCLFALSGDGAAHVSEAEVRWLFALDALTDGRDNDGAWGDLFVKGVLCHVMGRRPAALLARDEQHARLDWLTPRTASPLGFLARTFEGGLKTYRKRLGFSEVDAFEAHYAARVAEAAHDERLTVDEVAKLVAFARADGRQTANEAALLAEVRRLECAPA